MQQSFILFYSYLADAIDPLLDTEPVDVRKMLSGLFQRKFSGFKSVAALARTGEIIIISPVNKISIKIVSMMYHVGLTLGRDLPAFYELITAPASKISKSYSV